MRRSCVLLELDRIEFKKGEKTMKKLFMCVALIAVLFFVPTMTEAAEYEMVIAHYSISDPVEQGMHASLVYFKSMVEARTGGNVEVRIFGDMVLGSPVEYARETIRGDTVQSAILYSGSFSSFYEKYQLMTSPFLFPDYRTAWTFFDSDYFAAFMDEARKETGLRFLGIYDDGGGLVAFTNSRRLIQTPDDMAGLRIRTEENPAHIAMIEALGARAVPLAWGDVVTALASGVAEGQFNAPSVNNYAKFWEVTDYTSWIPFVYNTAVWTVSDVWFEKLPEEYQEIIIATAYEAIQVARGVDTQRSTLYWVDDAVHYEDTYMPTPEVQEQWQEILRPAFYEWITEDFGIDADLVDEFWAEVDRQAEELNKNLMETRGKQ